MNNNTFAAAIRSAQLLLNNQNINFFLCEFHLICTSNAHILLKYLRIFNNFFFAHENMDVKKNTGLF